MTYDRTLLLGGRKRNAELELRIDCPALTPGRGGLGRRAPPGATP